MTGRGNTTWLIRGRVPTLVDAGTGDPRHLDDVQAALGGATLERVLVTHAHVDHASGAPAIGQRMPRTRFHKKPWPARDGRYAVSWEAIDDGDVLAAGDDTLRAIHTPGHAPDHLCFWHEPTRILFCGDLAVRGTTVVIPASSGGDLTEYIASLERVLALAPSKLLPAHGPLSTIPNGSCGITWRIAASARSRCSPRSPPAMRPPTPSSPGFTAAWRRRSCPWRATA
jgi:glyoxylase-like metal-dependent hydrolase (beta-lactamase superfamily II)